MHDIQMRSTVYVKMTDNNYLAVLEAPRGSLPAKKVRCFHGCILFYILSGFYHGYFVSFHHKFHMFVLDVLLPTSKLGVSMSC